MKKQVLFTILMLLPLVAMADDSGTCGDNLTWTYIEATKTLTISGEGNMTDYAWNNHAPWYNYKDKIEKVIIDEGVCSIGDFAFDQCEQMTSISIPNSVTSIGYDAFRICSSLKEVTIPQKVNKINEGAFYACDGLTSVYISDIESWCKIDFGDDMSNPCSYAHHLYLNGEILKKLVVPDNITIINDYAFYGCTTLVSVTMNNSVTTIGEGAFAYCSALTSFSISDNVTSIGKMAFFTCENLVSIKIPNGVTTIDTYSFGWCRSLTSITLPNSVVSIGDRSFEGCESMSFIKFSDNLSSIGNRAFYGCKNLTSLKMPDNIEVISNEAFAECSNIKEVEIGNNTKTIGTCAFYKCIELRDLKIGDSVEDIEQSAFMYCYSLQSLVLPNSVKKIGMQAFCLCQNLLSVTIGLGLNTMSVHAFSGSHRIEEVHIQSLKSFCNINFEDELSNPLLYAQHLFCQGNEINNLVIPEEVASIGNYAFVGFSGLNSVIIPNDIITIGESAFKDCSSITSIILSDKLQFIKSNAFNGCNSLKTVTIPASVEFIYQEAFANCYNLNEVRALPEEPPFLYNNSFSNWNITLKVPKGCKEAYQAAQGWKNFTNISDADKYKLTYMLDNEEYKCYDIEEGETITPEAAPTKEGYTFSGWSEIPATMPSHDVTVTGNFSINSYTLTYMVDGTEYKTVSIEYGSTITAESIPTKDGYTFSGWSEIPETMPAHDVTITGSFSINSYTLTYMVDGVEYKKASIEYGSSITAETAPTKEGYTFSGWSEIPATMPAHDVTVTGTFSINSYKVTFMYGDNVLTTIEVKYGEKIELPTSLNSERYTLIEWLNVPETMPAQDITIYADYVDGINDIAADSRDAQYIQLNGMYTTELKSGLNIIRMKDGTTKKVWVK